jgi:hypothetical protein
MSNSPVREGDIIHAEGIDASHAAWQHATITNHPELSREMMTTFIHLPPQRLSAPASCFAQGTDRTAAKVRPLSGRTTE